MANPEFIAKQKTNEQFMGHLTEEAGEVVSAIGKIMRFGPNSTNPLLPVAEQETNRMWLLRELFDLQGAVERFLGREYTDEEMQAEQVKRVQQAVIKLPKVGNPIMRFTVPQCNYETGCSVSSVLLDGALVGTLTINPFGETTFVRLKQEPGKGPVHQAPDLKHAIRWLEYDYQCKVVTPQ